MPEYQPGVCNINQEGVKYRRNVGNVASVIGLGLLVVATFAVSGVIAVLLGVVGALTLFIGVLNHLQAKNSFCASHGMAGTQQAADGATETEQVADEKAVAKDKARSTSMLLQAAGITVLISVVFVVLALVT